MGKEKGKGEQKKPRQASGKPFTGAGEEDRAGLAARRARPRGHRGQAARRRCAHPLGSAHTGEGGRRQCHGRLRSLSVARCARCAEVERGESGEEERGSSRKNELGFRSQARGVGFYMSEMRARPSDVNGWPRLNGPSRGPGGRAGARDFAGLGPGCGLGAACARERKWAEPFLRFLGRNSKV